MREDTQILEHIKNEIEQELLIPRIKLLTLELTQLLLQEKYNICEDFDKFIALQFEYNTPLDFYFVGYPTTELFDGWNETAIIELDAEQGNKKFRKIYNKYDLDKLENQNDFDDKYQKLIEQLQVDFFANCWKVAKKNAKSNKRCFLFEHDMSTCWDCDNDEKIHEREIKNRI